MTGEPGIDVLLECGPRVFDPDVPAPVRQEVGKSASLGWYREALKVMAQRQAAEMHAEIANISRENRAIENSSEFKACDGIGYPAYRLPMSVYFYFEGIYGAGCWKEEAFVEDFLKHHPGLRIKVTRGTRGQEYAGLGRRRIDGNTARGAASEGNERDQYGGSTAKSHR